MKKNSPRILLLDIETSPIISYTWGIWQQDIGLNQIKKDWHLLSFSAKWLNDKKMIYMDQRNNVKNIEDDRKLLNKLWELLDECDILITQNGKQFDIKKINARFILNGLTPPSSYKHVDTKQIAKRKFGFTSNKLEYMTNKLNVRYKKLKHSKFAGFDLWTECLAGNKDAWKEMEKYNNYDVLSLEELYLKLAPWDNSINYNLYTDTEDTVCNCGNEEFSKNGFCYTSIGKYQRYSCKKCGAEVRGRNNLFSKEKKQSIKAKV